MKRLPVFVLACTATTLALAQTPPAIPHPIDGYVVDKDENSCLECHDKPRDIGRKRAKDIPVPAPKTHYASGDAKPRIDAAHLLCTGCHKKP